MTPAIETLGVPIKNVETAKKLLHRAHLVLDTITPDAIASRETWDYLWNDLNLVIRLLTPQRESRVNSNKHRASTSDRNLHETNPASLQTLNDIISIFGGNIKTLIAVIEPENTHDKSSSPVDNRTEQADSTGEDSRKSVKPNGNTREGEAA